MSYDVRHFQEGIARKKTADKGFVYYYIDNGKEVTQKDIERISKLKIPPNWTDVWVSRDPSSSIQAIGMDAKGRKQYKYHNVHIETVEKEKFARMYEFIKSMPKLEKIMLKHNELPIYDKNRVISLMLQMVRDYHMRVGKEVYAKKNKSYGISSLRKKHVKLEAGVIYLNFKGKSNQRLRFTIKNDFYVRSIKLLLKLDGENLFQYVNQGDENRERILKISDRDLNAYIHEHMGVDFTIKDFRTFGANWYFIKALLNETKKRRPKNRKIIKKNIVNAFRVTAKQLKHTGAVAKKSYVLNFALELYQNDPDFFIKRKDSDPGEVLLELLNLYKKKILKE